MQWRELGWLRAIFAVFLLVYMPWNTLIDLAKEEIKSSRKKNVL